MISHSKNESTLYGVVLEIARQLVDHPEAVHLSGRTDSGTTTISLTVHAEDLKRVLGARGATQKSLQTIASAVARKQQSRCVLEITQPMQPSRSSTE